MLEFHQSEQSLNISNFTIIPDPGCRPTATPPLRWTTGSTAGRREPAGHNGPGEPSSGDNLKYFPVCSTLIGRGSTKLGSHWSRWFIVLLRQCLLCHKEPVRRIQSPLLGAFCLLLAGSSWHKNSWLPCTEKSYYRRPYAIKNQRGASKRPLVGGFGCDELVLYGIRLLARAKFSTNESRASLSLDQ